MTTSAHWLLAAALRQNTLHGFPVIRRADNGSDIQLALFDEDSFEEKAGHMAVSNWLDAIRVSTGAQSVHVVSNYGRNALSLDVGTDYDKRRAVLDAALRHLPHQSLRLTLQNRLGPTFGRGDVVTVTTMEQQFIYMCERYDNDRSLVLLLNMMMSGGGRPVCHEGMWSTDAMRFNVRRLVDSRKIAKFVSDSRDVWEFGAVVDEQLDWPHVVSTAELDAPATTTATAAVDVSGDKEPCMICLDRMPNTMVLPCMHVVVCTLCSAGLRSTPDKNTCVQCRRSITSVLDE